MQLLIIFPKSYSWSTMQKNICKTVISGKEQNLNKQMAECGISILFLYFMYILTKCNTLSRS